MQLSVWCYPSGGHPDFCELGLGSRTFLFSQGSSGNWSSLCSGTEWWPATYLMAYSLHPVKGAGIVL